VRVFSGQIHLDKQGQAEVILDVEAEWRHDEQTRNTMRPRPRNGGGGGGHVVS